MAKDSASVPAGGGEGPSAHHASERRPAASPVPAAVFDLSAAVEHCFGNHDLFQDMVGFFFDDADSLLRRIQTALHGGDAAQAGIAAHRLKGTLSHLGAAVAFDAAQRVEQAGRTGDARGAGAATEELGRQIESLKAALAPHRRHASADGSPSGAG